MTLASETTLMKELIRAVVKDPAVARQVVGATLVDQTANTAKKTLDELGMAPDDEVDPVVPTGVTVIGGARALFVRWAKAPAGDRVARTIVRVQPPASGVAREVSVPHDDGAAHVPDLSYNDPAGNTVTPAAYSVTIRHVDRYGRPSPVFGPVTARPDPTFADSLKADTVIAGRIEALVSIVSGGKVAAGGAAMGPNGLGLTEVATALSAPDVSRGSKITPDVAQPFSAIGFFDIPDTRESYPKRGVHVRADGNASQFRRGQLRYEATGNEGRVDTPTHALLLIQGGMDGSPDETFVRVSPRLRVGGTATIDGFLDVNAGAGFAGAVRSAAQVNVGPAGGPFNISLTNTGGQINAKKLVLDPSGRGGQLLIPYRSPARSVDAGDTTAFDHNLGKHPDHVQVFYQPEPGEWRDVDEVEFIYIPKVNEFRIQVVNHGNVAHTLRATAF